MGFVSFVSGLFAQPKGRLSSLYDLKMNSLDGQLIDFDRYRGKTLMIVNTASKCGHTPQYTDLQKLHEELGDKVTILGFPANNFLWQEPGSNDDIAAFCKKNFGVTFQMFEKISVKGRNRHPLYRWLESESGALPSWNFCKYIVDKNGKVVAFFGPKVNPRDQQIIDLILP